MLVALQGVGGTSAAVLAREVFARSFASRRHLGSYFGLTSSAYDEWFDQEIARASPRPATAGLATVPSKWHRLVGSISRPARSRIGTFRRSAGQSNGSAASCSIAMVRRELADTRSGAMSKPGSFPRARSSPRRGDDARHEVSASFCGLWNPDQGSRGGVTGLEDTIGVFRAGENRGVGPVPRSSVLCMQDCGKPSRSCRT